MTAEKFLYDRDIDKNEQVCTQDLGQYDISELLEEYAALKVAEERERCAKVAEREARLYKGINPVWFQICRFICKKLTAKIREGV